jgi:hypothetical protein
MEKAAFGNVAALVRTWNNNQGVVKAVQRALNAGIGLVVVVVKADDPGTRGNVRGWLGGLMRANPGRVRVEEMVSGYGWSPALNLGFEAVRRENDRRLLDGAAPIPFILNASCEALWEAEHLAAMVAAMEADAKLGAVGTSFVGFQNGNRVDLGQSYAHPRNTLCLVRIAAYDAAGGYSNACDGHGGMEDLHHLLRMEVRGWSWVRLDLGVRLLVGLNHHQPTKESREIAAIRAILADEIALAVRMRDALRRLGVEDLAPLVPSCPYPRPRRCRGFFFSDA